MTKYFIHSYLSKKDLQCISETIVEVEKKTRAEIRVCIRQHRHLREKKLDLSELAMKEFHRLGIEKTQERTGVLIFFLLSERKFYILADEGIHKSVENGTWDRIANGMSKNLREKKLSEGICDGIKSIGAILSDKFPSPRDTKDELSNEVVID